MAFLRLCLLVALFCPALSLWAATTLSGKIVGVSDGDTVTLLTQNKEQFRLRLYGIDAPESQQAFGQASKKALSDLAFGKMATAEVKTTDRFGRKVAVLRVKGVNLNEAQVEAGMAWWYRAYAKKDKRLQRLELKAQQERRGLWQDPSPVPPWEFRRKPKR